TPQNKRPDLTDPAVSKGVGLETKNTKEKLALRLSHAAFPNSTPLMAYLRRQRLVSGLTLERAAHSMMPNAQH
ncbi:MAG: hypothetical protein WCA11_06740, partial [Terracidiphilus sp.]